MIDQGQRTKDKAQTTKDQGQRTKDKGRAAGACASTWLCHQLGSREHYSIPRALERSGHLGLFQTDAWVQPNWQWLAKALKQAALASRFHPELASVEVRAFTLGRLAFDLGAKLSRKDTWTTIRDRDIWFQQKCLPKLKRSLAETNKPIVFSYAYTARKLFELAKQEGATCVLGQVDPGPGELAHLKRVLPSEIAAQIEDRPESYWTAWREEIALADHILVNSSWSKELLIKFSAVPEEKIEIIPLAYTPEGVEAPKEYPERFTNERPLKLLYLGQVIHRKGVHLLLEATERLAGQPLTLDLVGPIAPELRQLTDSLSHRPPVPRSSKSEVGTASPSNRSTASPTHRFTASPSNRLTAHGPVDSGKAKQLYREADVFLLPTLSDGFALTQLEAAAHKLPIIASRYCGEVVRDRENGWLLEEVTVEHIEAAIRHCLQHPTDLQRWAGYALDWDQYSLEALGERLLRLGAFGASFVRGP